MRVGILTSGGDCQALNVTMRGLAKTLYRNVNDIEIIGFLQGYKGLMYEDYKIMKPKDFSGIINIGGTILGTSRCPFKKMRVIEDDFDKVAAMKNTYAKLKLDCLVVLGGNGSIKSANMLSQEGLNVIALPKTIDNDTWGTDYTFGYQSAIDIATTYLDQIHTTAASHNRVFVIEVMGHKVGHIAEGALSKEEATLSKKEYKAKVKARNGQSVVYEIAAELEKYIDSEIRVSCIGHAQRGGQPCPYDRMISTQFGVAGARLVMGGDYGKLVILKNNGVTAIPLVESAGKLKYVDAVGAKVKDAKLLGISFGD